MTPASYDPFQKETGEGPQHVHGGPTPPGFYICHYIAKHPTFHECIYLEQTLLALIDVSAGQLRFYDRDGFFIHGRGRHGSDGCIVPENGAERSRLNKALKKAKTEVLRVVDPGMPVPVIFRQVKAVWSA